MAINNPLATLDSRFSSADAKPKPWADAREQLEKAEIYWLSTVRPDGRPHVTPLIGVWLDDAFYFCTGGEERKAENLTGNPQCTITTGCNSLSEGVDLVVEGEAIKLSDQAKIQRVADAYASKYEDPMWHFKVRDGAFDGGQGNIALVYEVRPIKALGFARGKAFSQTRWRFDA